MNLDPDQSSAVSAPGSVVVVAGAGTGKTHMLSQRYLHHLRERGLRPLQVVAVTFTRRAADELRSRIRKALQEEVRQGDSGLEPALLSELEAAPIGTIHSLAQRICQAFPDAAEVPPDIAVLDEIDGALWTAEALEAALERLSAADVTSLPFSLLKASLRRLLEDPYRAEAALAKEAQVLRSELEEARGEALERARDEDWREAVMTLEAAAGPSEHPAEEARRAALAAVAALSAGGNDFRTEERAWIVLAGLRPQRGRSAEWRRLGQGDLAGVKASLKVLRDAARAAWQDGRGPAAWRWSEFDDEMLARTVAVGQAFSRVRADLAARKRRAKLVDFGDLEVHALRALERPEVRSALGLRWRALLVDEYQDTSPAQARLLELLRGDAELTVVGDEKQSIYAFRGADVRAFRTERGRLTAVGGAASVALDISYRSHRKLVDTVNGLFDTVLGSDAAPLRAFRRSSTLPGPHVRLLELDARGVEPEETAFAEASRIALEIKDLLDAEPSLRVDDGAGRSRPLRAGDVAVLARSRASLAALEALAPALGVPVLNAGGGDVLATREGLDAFALLAAVVDPSDAPAVLATLRGPYVAASDPAIHALARAARAASGVWWSRLSDSPDARLQAGARLLGDLRALHVRGAGAVDLLREADERCAYSAVLANLPNASRRLADYGGFVALVAQLEAGTADAFALTRRLRRLRAAGVRVPRPPLRSRDAVALMTIHGAKGLEWPVVVIADMSRASRAQSDEVVVDPDLGVTLRWRDGEGGWREPSLFLLAEERRRQRELAEDARLAYVALTRARDLLILSSRSGSGGLRSLLAPGLDAASLVPEVTSIAPGSVPPLPPLPPTPVGVDDTDRFWAVGLTPEAPSGSASRDHGHPSLVEPPLPPPDPYADAPLFAAEERSPTPATSAGAWERTLAALANLDEDGTWQRAAAVLADAALPAPHLGDVLSLMSLPDGRRVEVLMRWPRDTSGRWLALAAPEDLAHEEVRVEEGTFVALDPLDPEASLPRLRAALVTGEGPGESPGTSPGESPGSDGGYG